MIILRKDLNSILSLFSFQVPYLVGFVFLTRFVGLELGLLFIGFLTIFFYCSIEKCVEMTPLR